MTEAVILFATGILLIGVSIVLRRRMNNTITNGYSTDGIIFDFEQRDGYNYPVVRFCTLQQEWITQTSKLSYVPHLFKKGQQVTIVFDPHNPADFYIDSKWTRITPLLLLAAGIITVVAGVLWIAGVLPLYP